jgi:hypothetical protein
VLITDRSTNRAARCPFGCYEVIDGVAHWRKEQFADYVRRNQMSWPRHDSGALDETDQTFCEIAARYPQIKPLRELRYSLSKLQLNDLSVGSDGRNRTPLWPYGTKIARNAPSNSKFIFGPPSGHAFTLRCHPAACSFTAITPIRRCGSLP